MRIAQGETELVVTVAGYQFPELQIDPYSADWLDVQLVLTVGPQQWQCLDPALMTYEVEKLCDWLEEAGRNVAFFENWTYHSSPIRTDMSFTEPNLEFELCSTGLPEQPFRLRALLAAEFLPPFSQQLPHFTLDIEISQVWLDFHLSADDLRDLVYAMRNALARFPVRAGRPVSPRTSKGVNP